MALINCRNCGRPVSDRAERCPHCGAPVRVEQTQGSGQQTTPPPRKSNNAAWIAVFLVAVLIIGIVVAAIIVNGDDTETADNEIETADVESSATAQSEQQAPTTQPEEPSEPTSGNIEGHEWVDIGLSVKWATCNVGASSPGEYGSHFAWGETSSKLYYGYDENSSNNKVTGSIAGDPSYDAARSNWGGTWRLPTASEIDELVNKCQWTWTRMGGHNGYKVTGPNGNSIFLPAAGDCNGQAITTDDINGAGNYGGYWSATPSSHEAYYLSFGSGGHQRSQHSRYYGRSVRAVSGTMKQTTQTTTTQGAKVSSPTWTINGHGYVDLGLSVKWATCNVGASSPEGYGSYYAWGETSTKSSYDEDNSRTWEVSMGSIAGNPSYDAARANWVGTWRLPTADEIDELTDKCKWTWTTVGGHNGYKVTGPNGNSIFLPAAGFRCGASLLDAGEYGFYWSATPIESYTRHAYELYFGSGYFYRYGASRDYGQSVRAVSE
ncbi:MAG: zinc-ribbon domain-containing protein [Prevotellaceae bacterium]|nr:zinc-ribbon domain-containing protein [Prevotellaceae bacterium]